MKKVLIISYFYPPANFVGAQRTASWAKYLHAHDFYPIIVTRQWNQNQTDLIDKVKNNELEIEYNSSHEVHRLPYKRSFRDRCSTIKWLKPVQKFLTLCELIASNYSIRALPYANFYTYCHRLIKENADISIVIASGRPFQSFAIGHQLKKDFPGIHWIPDYRDEWSTRGTNNTQSILQRKLTALESNSEKKWVSNASFFMSVSELCVNNIKSFTGVLGKIVLNGFDEMKDQVTEDVRRKNKSKLNVLYVGSIYDYQDFIFILEALREINEKCNNNIILTFLGSYSNDRELNVLNKLTDRYRDFVDIMPKVKKEQVKKYIEQSDLLFLTEYKNLGGCLPVKIFDYFKSDKPILLCPSDDDLMEKFIKETNSGYITNSVEECKAILCKLIALKEEGEALIGPRNTEKAYFYSRKHQTQRLAEYLDELN